MKVVLVTTPTGKRLVRAKSEKSGIDSVSQGDLVSYETEERQGRVQAVNISIVN